MAKKSFVQGAVILGIAGIIIKLMGAVFRIPLANMIGDQGMAYYQAAYPIYVLFLTVATAGIPIAISRMVSERTATGNHHAAHRVFKVSFLLMLIIGVVSFVICFFGAEIIVGIIGMPKAVHAMRGVSIALLFVPVMAAYRGYFQGQQNMNPTALSQVVEQFFRVAVGLFAAFFLMRKGTEYAAAGASFGAAAGAMGGLGIIMIIYFLKRSEIHKEIAKGRLDDQEERVSDILKTVFLIAIPITIGAAIMPIMNFIDAGLVVNRLQATGWTHDEAESLYGQLSGFAGSFINFPQVLTQAVAMSIVPAVAASFKLKDHAALRNDVNVGLRIAIIVGLPCALGLMSLAEPIMLMIYPMQKASAVGAAECLFVMAFGVIFLSTIQLLTGVLQGIGKQMIPVKNLFIGVIFKLIATYFLTGIPAINAKGAAIGTVIAYIIAAILDFRAVKKYTGAKFNVVHIYGKPAAASIIMAGIAYGSHRLLYGFIGNTLATLVAVGLGAMTYFILLFVTKAITREEVLRMPKGNKLVKIFDKFFK